MPYNILVFNQIAAAGLAVLPASDYQITTQPEGLDAILLRSQKLHDWDFSILPKVVVRAGAGVNNIPVEKFTEHGIPVLNTPGANANAVKELVIAGLILASRQILSAWQYTKQLDLAGDGLSQAIEAGKKQFVGQELQGKVLGVVGLGAIGVQVANCAHALGMQVIGYDPMMSVQQAWRVEAGVQQATSLDECLAAADFVSLHIPANAKTTGLIDAGRLAVMKPSCVLLNFARDVIVEQAALLAAITQQRLGLYVTDFPQAELLQESRVVCLPHLGASTHEAEENCAVMAAQQLRQFLETGQIQNSVNFPEAVLPWKEGHRLVIINQNIPNMVGQVSTILAAAGLNVLDMINKSRGDVALTLLDLDRVIPAEILTQLVAVEGVISARFIR